MVVAAAEHQLLVVLADPLPDRVRPGEVERRAGHRRDLPGRDQRLVDRRVAARVQLQRVVVDRPHALARQVPVGVVGEVDDRGLVRRRGVVHLEVVALVERVVDLHLQRAGIAALAVGARARHLQSDLAAARERLSVPDALVEALEPAVQAVRAVVDVELVRRAVERELRGADPVAVAADDRAEVRRVRRRRVAAPQRVAGQVGEAERHVRLPAAPVGRPQLLDDPAVRDDRHRHVPVRERVAVDLGAVVELPEARLLDRQRAVLAVVPTVAVLAVVPTVAVLAVARLPGWLGGPAGPSSRTGMSAPAARRARPGRT